ncbi:DUF2290 domain-containing protein [Pseudomonas oryzihabitans]|uniref:DUF2290 domain-containing protein n=1 Tax=Pseudomonas oryzihabitans TaxID=47885 RepID=UPI00111E7099|nr:DUF2290 domain-containing protein [Pseudomonas psychrotolerans]QDD87709.1 hypothetical protein CCZ28_01245 [Pseudomonas psychrotolerans]
MKFAHAEQGIRNAIRHLASHTQVQNSCIIHDELQITWQGRKPGIYKNSYYPIEYQKLLDSQQYSVLLSDGSFFQFYYGFDATEKLQKGRLAFYPSPIKSSSSQDEIFVAAEEALDREDLDLYNHLYNWTELMESQGHSPCNTSHIRFDFDAAVTAHCQSHMQISGVQELRIAADFFPQPLAFVQICEAVVHGLSPMRMADLSFERRHSLNLDKPGSLIHLINWPE